MKKICYILFLLIFTISIILAEKSKDILLPKPNLADNFLLILKTRKSSKDFNPNEKEIHNKYISEMLWAGFGINRENGGRTIPTAKNLQDLDIYVIKKTATYKYDAKKILYFS